MRTLCCTGSIDASLNRNSDQPARPNYYKKRNRVITHVNRRSLLAKIVLVLFPALSKCIVISGIDST
jgi:hypothetical protein